MPLSSTVLASLIQSNMMSAGANGSNLTSFCTAIATGIVNSIVGVAFTSADTGLTSATGTLSGTGITGLSSSSMTTTALATMTSQGTNAFATMNSIMNAVVQHLSTAATFTGTDPIVYSGTGTINIGSIGVVLNTMHTNINNELLSAGANGVNRDNLSLSIATGITTNILSSGSGNVTITGTPPGSPTPGNGTGTGTIS